MDDFTALIELFKPMFHTMLLIWKHSGHYNTSAKMVTLIREMCNDLIMQACKFVPGMHNVMPEELLFFLTQTLLLLQLLQICSRHWQTHSLVSASGHAAHETQHIDISPADKMFPYQAVAVMLCRS